MNDDLLLEELRNGNRQAFEQLFERYWKPLYMASLKRIREEADAKDLLQDLFVSIWVRREQLPEHVSWASYLHGALRHKIINYLQASRVRIEYANAVLHAYPEPAAAETDSRLLTDDLRQVLEQATDAMPGRMKEIFLLSYSDGYTPHEIAERLSLSLQTVKNHLAESKSVIRRFLAHYPADGWAGAVAAIYPVYILLMNS